MGPTFRIQVFRKQQLAFTGQFAAPVEIGRQQKPDEPLLVEQPAAGGKRIAIARLGESTISRTHLRLEPMRDERIRATNLSKRNEVLLDDGSSLEPESTREIELPTLMTIAFWGVRVERPVEEDEAPLHTLAMPTILPPLRGSTLMPTFSPLGSSAAPQQSPESLVTWLQTVIGVLQSAASSTDFFQRAAEAIVQLVGLDTGRVLLADGQQWRTAAHYYVASLQGNADEWRPSGRILTRMRQEKRTFWHAPDASGQMTPSHSLQDVQAVVVSPLLDASGEVIGALYGDRRRRIGTAAGPTITKLEAMIVETLACGVAAGLSRMEQEQKVVAARVQFEQFFTPELAHQLTVEPDLLKGRDAEVSVLFADIRGFSRISDRLGPAGTVEWLSDVMGELSDCVSRHGGVLVDYIGDELMAMWGAPIEQPDHPRLSCRAALDMWQTIPKLNERWAAGIGERFALGVGINTGIARVGNTGSHRKFKYGPLGSPVNIASRVQGATKYLKSGVVVTAATHDRLGDEFVGRRLCKVRVVNITEPIELFELRDHSDAAWKELCKQYGQALRQFEQQDFRAASVALGQLLVKFPDDGPSLVLLSRAVNHLVNSDVEFTEAWELAGK